MTKTTLKPCPFCGEPPELHIGSNGSNDTSDYFVSCDNDKCRINPQTNIFNDYDAAGAIADWNLRHD